MTVRVGFARPEETTVEPTSNSRAPLAVTAVAVGLVAVLLASVLAIVVVGQRGGPPVIHLASGGDMSVAPMEASEDELAPGPVVEFRFVLSDQARFGAEEVAAWRFEPPAALEEAAVGLAARLGVSGDPVRGPDGSMSIGPAEDTGAFLLVGRSGEWWLSAPPCDLDADEAQPQTCPPRPAAVGVPDAAEARTAAEVLFADVNPAVTTRVTEVVVDEEATMVVAALLVTGQDTGIVVSVTFGPQGVVVAGNGTLAGPVEIEGYPTIDADAAAARLEDQHAAQDWGKVLADPESDETEVRAVTLVAVEPRLSTMVDADGIQWLVPGVRFTDSDGRGWDVVTVADDFLVVADSDAPEPPPEPVDVEPEPAA